MIDIIIPAYNSFKTIDVTLSSIALQSCKDILNVYIINDGSSDNYKNYADFYKPYFNIKELFYKENKGPGYARRFGLEHSTSKYIMFIDSDDSLYDANSILKLYEAIKDGDYDFVNSIFCKQEKDELLYYEDDTVWLHGKIYKREFLIKNNITFNDTKSNEDNGFNTLLLLNNPKEKYLEEVTYIWTNNNDSITRKNNNSFKYDGMFGYVYNMVWALNQKLDDPQVSRIAFASLYVVYLKYIEFSDKKDINKLLKETNKLYKIYNLYPLSDKEKLDIVTLEFNNLHEEVDNKVLLKPYISFVEFLKLVGDNND